MAVLQGGSVVTSYTRAQGMEMPQDSMAAGNPSRVEAPEPPDVKAHGHSCTEIMALPLLVEENG